MRSYWRLLACVVLSLGVAVVSRGAEVPPWKRLLQGEDAKKVEALQKQINELEDVGKFAQAITPAEECLALRRRVQGDEHWQTGDARRAGRLLRQLADMPAEKQQRYLKASQMLFQAIQLDQTPPDSERLYRQVLTILEQDLGPQHPLPALVDNELANNLADQGQFTKAEPLYRQALAIREQVLGPGHPDTAQSYNNLGHYLHTQGKFAEADKSYRKALEIREQVLGPGHRDTARSYSNLASLLDSQGKYQDAEALFRKALAIRRQLLPPYPPEIASSYGNLAANQSRQGKYAEAEVLDRQALKIREEVFGRVHPYTALSYSNLGHDLDTQGKYAEAEALHRQALAIRLQVRGPGHSETAASYNNLAASLAAQGKLAEAQRLYQKAKDVCTAALGPGHPTVVLILNNLAFNLAQQRQFAEAEKLYREVLALRQQKLGPDHADTAFSLHNLAGNLDKQGKYDDAERLYRQALEIQEKVLGRRHPDTLATYHNLAGNLNDQGKNADAEGFYRKALAIREQVLGPQHLDTARNYHNLAYILSVQGKEAVSEPVWQQAVRSFEAARLRLAASGFERALAADIQPHLGLALCLARLGKAGDAAQAAEASLARGLLDDLSLRAALSLPPDEVRRLDQRGARLEQLDRQLLPLLTADKLDASGQRRREEWLRERFGLQAEIDREAAEQARREVFPLERIQQALPADAALVFWLDGYTRGKVAERRGWHWGCVVRRTGPPAWVRLSGSGPDRAWTDDDDRLTGDLRAALGKRLPEWKELARRLDAQRLAPLETQLAAREGLPAVRQLIAVPGGVMAGVPLEALTDQFRVSYAPSGTVLARLAEAHRPLREPSLLALGDPAFQLPSAAPPPPPPEHGLYLLLVLPDGNAYKAGLRTGDVLLQYAGQKLTLLEDLRPATEGDKVSVTVWRDGKTLDNLTVAPGKLGVSISKDAPAVALRRQREREALADSRRREDIKPLPGTRFEVETIRTLFPKDGSVVLLGSDASEQRLDELVAADKLKSYRVLHLATHGQIDVASARDSALLLARDQLPDPLEQAKRGRTVYDGRLTVAALARWHLDADLVTLSACETGLGRATSGEGFLGFTQVLFAAGARALVVSLWKVDDTATALLMTRFYENLRGEREGLKGPLGRGAALREAKLWLRDLSRSEVEALAAKLSGGELRGTLSALKPLVRPEEVKPAGKEERPYAHPYYWSGFVLLGDAD
ncbi:MAG TPA: tetratricopeptide repeat protein [Gemmataceae bacterium]|nr:tetratricopeptide repeat protein [Gemmataceae bacterium]